jgi:hypothetical protein
MASITITATTIFSTSMTTVLAMTVIPDYQNITASIKEMCCQKNWFSSFYEK